MKIKIFLTLFLLIAVLFTITGCGNNEKSTQEESISNTSSEEIKLNNELEGVYAFVQKIEENNNSKIVALKNDGTEIDITKSEQNEYLGLDYYSGKLYLQKDKNFYEIDLTKGNGNYELVKIFGYPMEAARTYDRYNYSYIYVYDGKLYFLKDWKELVEYDLKTKKVNFIVKADNIENLEFRMDKENGIIYYIESTPKFYLKSYNIKTKETKQIDEGVSRSNKYSSKGTNLPISFVGVGVNQGKILYSKGNFEDNGGSGYKTYLYDIISGGKLELEYITSGIYSDGKVYYASTVDDDMPYPPTCLKVYENTKVTEISEMQENDYTKFFDLGNGKVQAVMYWGQDISTEGEQAYTIDKKTNEVSMANSNYNIVHLIKDYENVSKVDYQDNLENKITVEQAEEIIKNKWGIEPDNNNETIPEANNYILQGGKHDLTIRDVDGLEYYVFSYSSKVGETSGTYHNTHIQTIFISVDGKKYKIRALGDNFEDKDIVTQFDEEGEI